MVDIKHFSLKLRRGSELGREGWRDCGTGRGLVREEVGAAVEGPEV
jgi:hypothetical protein